MLLISNSMTSIITILEKLDADIFDDYTTKTLMIDSLHGNIDAVVDAIVHTNNEDIYVINDKWYSFENYSNVWTNYDSIPRDMIANFIPMYDDIKKYIMQSNKINQTKKDEYHDQINKTIKNINKMKLNIISKLAKRLTTTKQFDMNMNLMGFSNGVYDFENMVFRRGTPDDAISKSCGYDFAEEYNDRKGLIIALSTMFPDKETMDYFLTYIATSMCGKNNSNTMLVFKWTNICHRDMLMKILSSTFGDYYCDIPNLKSIINTDNKIPINLENFKHVRILVAENVKNISTNDISKLLVVKQLKSHNKNINVQFSTLCMCEEKPDTNIDDDNVWDHIFMIYNPNKRYEMITFYKNDFFLLLLEYLEKFKCGIVNLAKYI